MPNDGRNSEVGCLSTHGHANGQNFWLGQTASTSCGFPLVPAGRCLPFRFVLVNVISHYDEPPVNNYLAVCRHGLGADVSLT